MNRYEIIKSVADRTALSRTKVGEVLDALIDTIHEAVAVGDRVDLKSLLTIKVVDKPARTGRNPQTGAEVQIAARRAVTIKPAAALKAAANRG